MTVIDQAHASKSINVIAGRGGCKLGANMFRGTLRFPTRGFKTLSSFCLKCCSFEKYTVQFAIYCLPETFYNVSLVVAFHSLIR